MNNNGYFVIHFTKHNNIFKIYKLILTFKILSIYTVLWLRRLSSFSLKVSINKYIIIIIQLILFLAKIKSIYRN